jgi:hypothetical protein
MNHDSKPLAIDDVLWAFTVEPNHDKQTFENYLREYPAYAAELADLLHQLTRTDLKEKELTDKDRLRIDEAWRQYSSSSSVAYENAFVSLSVPALRELANFCDVPRQIISAFREQKVVISSIPKRFLARLAEGLHTTIDQVKLSLTAPLQTTCANCYKSEEKPIETEPATFEQLLIDAQVPAEKRAELMSEEK